MIERCSMNNKAVEVKSKSHRIRAIEDKGEMMFVASDIAEACGIKAATKWVQRAAVTRNDLFVVTLDYPLMTARGRQKRKLCFVTAQGGRNIVDSLPCKDETKNWLETEVFTLKAEKREEEPNAEASVEKKEAMIADLKNAMQSKQMTESELGQRIDKILLELLEIKMCVVFGAGRR